MTDDKNDVDPVATRHRSTSYSSLYGHPVATRASLLQTAQDIASSTLCSSPVSTIRAAGLHEEVEVDKEALMEILVRYPGTFDGTLCYEF